MTRGDRWQLRPRGAAWRNWSTLASTLAMVELPRFLFQHPSLVQGLRVKAFIPFPKSYPSKRRHELSGQRCLSKPDVDNILKSVMDSLWENDEQIAEASVVKYWDDGDGARTEITVHW